MAAAKILRVQADELKGSEPWTSDQAVILDDWNVEDVHLLPEHCKASEGMRWLATLRALPERERVAALALVEGYYEVGEDGLLK